MTNEHENRGCGFQASWPMLASLALNLFLIGLVAAPLLSGERPDFRPMPPPQAPEFIFDHVSRELPLDEAKKLRGIFDEERKNMRLNRDAMHETMEKVAKALEAEKPDMAALKAALDDIPHKGQVLHERMVRAFSRVAGELSLESRRKIAERIKNPMQMRPHEGAPRPPAE